eukprot:m.56962 g.56962  ORF g.56962 m.56962 type:complete len:461 (-) comp13699_c1_seq4:104-1486(-)
MMAAVDAPDVYTTDHEGRSIESVMLDALFMEEAEESACATTSVQLEIEDFEELGNTTPSVILSEIEGVDDHVTAVVDANDFDLLRIPRSKAARQTLLRAVCDSHNARLLKYVLLQLHGLCSPGQLHWLLDNAPMARRQYFFMYPEASATARKYQLLQAKTLNELQTTQTYCALPHAQQLIVAWAIEESQRLGDVDAEGCVSSVSDRMSALLQAGKFRDAEVLAQTVSPPLDRMAQLWCYIHTFGPSKQYSPLIDPIRGLLRDNYSLYDPLFTLSELTWHDVDWQGETEPLPDNVCQCQHYLQEWIAALPCPQQQFLLYAFNGFEQRATASISMMTRVEQLQGCLAVIQQTTLNSRFPMLAVARLRHTNDLQGRLELLDSQGLIDSQITNLRTLLDPNTFAGYFRLPSAAVPVVEGVSQGVRTSMATVSEAATQIPQQASQAGQAFVKTCAYTVWQLTKKS